MTHRDLITALLLADKKYHRRIDAALQERHTMTRLAAELEIILAAYVKGELEGQQYTDLDGMCDDPEFRPCFETAIADDAGAIFDQLCGSPLAGLDRLQAAVRDEYNEQEPEWRAKLEEGQRVNNSVDEVRSEK